MDGQIVALQEVIAHLQADMQRMSEEIYAQQQEIAVLRLLTGQMKAQMVQWQAALAGDSGKEPPPPHY